MVRSMLEFLDYEEEKLKNIDVHSPRSEAQ
jgi:hypothetical protein